LLSEYLSVTGTSRDFMIFGNLCGWRPTEDQNSIATCLSGLYVRPTDVVIIICQKKYERHIPPQVDCGLYHAQWSFAHIGTSCLNPLKHSIHRCVLSISVYYMRSVRLTDAGFEVLWAVTMKITIFWAVPPRSQVQVHRRFGGTYRLHLQESMSMPSNYWFLASFTLRYLRWRWRFAETSDYSYYFLEHN
jgi:hypothetical protein